MQVAASVVDCITWNSRGDSVRSHGNLKLQPVGNMRSSLDKNSRESGDLIEGPNYVCMKKSEFLWLKRFFCLLKTLQDGKYVFKLSREPQMTENVCLGGKSKDNWSCFFFVSNRRTSNPPLAHPLRYRKTKSPRKIPIENVIWAWCLSTGLWLPRVAETQNRATCEQTVTDKLNSVTKYMWTPAEHRQLQFTLGSFCLIKTESLINKWKDFSETLCISYSLDVTKNWEDSFG